MEDSPVRDTGLYPLESFNLLLEHEVNRSRRYGQPLTLLHLAFEIDPATPQIQHSAELFVTDILNLRLREADIPSKKDDEFLILLPVTNEAGGRAVCKRLEQLLNVGLHSYNSVPFKLLVFIGMATLPGDDSLSSKKLLQNAALALQHARTHHLKQAVIFSEMKD